MQPQVHIADTDADALDPDATAVARPAEEADLVVDELLVEDVSIDGMCGVY